MNYHNMPMRAFGITFLDDRKELPEQVFEGRMLSEAIMFAESHMLDNPCLEEPTPTCDFKETWSEHWAKTDRHPQLTIKAVRDLGIIMNTGVPA